MEPTDAPDSDLARLDRVLGEHRGRLLIMLRGRIDPALRPRIDAEEILQEVYLVARGKWVHAGMDPAVKPYPWLYRIALDTLIEAWRRQTRGCRDARLELPWPEYSSIQMGLDLVRAYTSPSEAFTRKEVGEQMRSALDRLKPDDRQILQMRHTDGLSFREVAAVLDITENAASVRYLRAIRRLRDVWKRTHREPPIRTAE